MSRSGYTDDMDDTWSFVCWRGAVNSAIKGKRGQEFLKELTNLMDVMPEKKLTEGVLEADGEFCTLGVVANARGVEVNRIDDAEEAAEKLGIARSMALEIVYENDECGWWDYEKGVYGKETPEGRWKRMRKWVDSQIVKEKQ